MPTKTPYFSFEKAAQSLSLILLLGTGSLFIFGTQQAPKVHLNVDQPQELSPKTQQLSWTFSQEMDVKSVEESFQTNPQLQGSLSWAGRKLVFSLEEPLGYDKNISIHLSGTSYRGKALPETIFNVASTQPSFAFINLEQELSVFETGSQQLKVLSPPGFKVLEYQWSLAGQDIAFLAKQTEDALPQLFTFNFVNQELTQWTDSEKYLNLTFAFAPNGESVLLDRVERDPKTGVPGMHALWKLTPNKQKLFWYPGLQGQSLFFSPDGSFVLGSDLGEFTLLPFEQSKKAPQFLGTFARSFGFSPNGEKALFVDGSKLISMSQNGELKTLYQGLGEVQKAAFSQNAQQVFFSLFYLEENAQKLFRVSTGNGYPAEVPLSLYGTWDLDVLTQALVYECQAQTLCLYQDSSEALNLKGTMPKWRP
jgi:hypothetical protein